MKKILLILGAITFLVSCGKDQDSSEKTITGNISNITENTMVYFDYITPTEVITKDSSAIDTDGNFSFQYVIDETAFYRLRLNDQNMVTLVLEKNEKPTSAPMAMAIRVLLKWAEFRVRLRRLSSDFNSSCLTCIYINI